MSTPAAASSSRVKRGVCPELGDVGEDGHAGGLAEFGVHRELGDGFGEDHVGSGGNVGLGAVDGGGQAFAGERVGAGHDDKLTVGTRIPRRP